MKTSPAVHGQTLPGWATPHNLAVIAVAVIAALVIIKLASAVGHLSRGARAAATPAPAPKKSGGGMKLLLLAGLGGAGFWYWDTHLRSTPAGTVKAAPSPAPSPSPTPTPTPRPTVTQTVAPHITMPGHFPLTGGQVVIAIAIVALVGFAITRIVVRNLP